MSANRVACIAVNIKSNHFNPNNPVQVCGVIDGKITSNGSGSMMFSNFAEAKKVFPDLDPSHNGKRFTWAMYGEKNATRFDTWELDRILSV